ncbi:MAG: hypothetical protein J6V80_06425 [Clostridia bacterium]|nr:hypothetical protein [Clostridia bacterium]
MLHTTLVEQSSSARLQAGIADSLWVDYLAQVTTCRLSITIAVAVAIEEACK